ncbi:alpha/beta fold hydrolase [Tahibacter amnicola]|uniref:Alpha/beta fold hydrolase n=1 Tax=Tahibacter amnicola TaxID=2976241 RepID=A0ABY6BKW4_9GAMM|nr:alpha/beta fold hydrolase [Tahibacter amnicola]UXI70261.1 alpha/beta fold hydrolase [Tahibacter amnicola]
MRHAIAKTMLVLLSIAHIPTSAGSAVDGLVARNAVLDEAADKAAQERLNQVSSRFVAEEFEGKAGVLRYRMLSPQTMSGEHPLVVVLHGSGGIGLDDKAPVGALAHSWELPEIAKAFPAYVVMPLAPARTAVYTPDASGVAVATQGPAFAAVVELINHLVVRLPVDRSRIYVVGWSMGGSAALQMLTLDQPRIAAAMAFSPVAPSQDVLPRPIPLTVVHGTEDTENAYAPTLAWCRAYAAGGAAVTHVSYSGMGHRLPMDLLASPEWRRWLFAQGVTMQDEREPVAVPAHP